ncbi:MAG: hypothetical protein LBU66_07645 [Treponema sp.]|jgi:hypothetical protein|nr:hypothetical protein [Treponema sp.]
MNRIGNYLLNIAVALYLFSNGIAGFNENSHFAGMINTIFGKGDLSNVLTIILSICAIAAGIFMLMKLFRVQIRVTDLLLMVFVCVWTVFIVLVDIIGPMNQGKSSFNLEFMMRVASHLMVLGALASSTKRFGG